MRLRRLGLPVLVLLLLVGAGLLVDARSDLAASDKASLRAAACRGLDRDDVRGAEPGYTRKELARFRNHRHLCRGVWLPRPRRHLVPQGLAVSGRTAWVSGYRHRKGYGRRPCQLLRVDLRTGRRLAFHRAILGRVGQRPRTYCRHGGGIVQRGRWLWVVERSKLWLVDPSQRRPDLEARRAWRIEAPVKGSAVVATDRSIGLVPFETRRAGRIYWYPIRRLQRPGVLDLAVRSRGRHQLGASRSTPVPTLVQGATLDRKGRLYLARSNLSCGELVTPGGRRIAFIPGAEGIQLAAGSRRFWTVSESGARPYAALGKPFTPAIAAYEWPRLLRGKPSGCGFRTGGPDPR